MMPSWSQWKTYPRGLRGDTIEAPIGPGMFEVRDAVTGTLLAFEAVDNLAHALATFSLGKRSLMARLLRRSPPAMPELVYRTCATASRADARTAAARMLGRRDVYLAGAA
jgi:hypothetical protein